MSSLLMSADFLWKLLVIVTLASTSVMAAFMLAEIFLRRTTGELTNRIAQFSVASILVTILAGGSLLVFADRDLQESCFGSFAAAQGNFSITRMLGGTWLVVAIALLLKDGLQYFSLIRRLRSEVQETRDGYIVTSENVPPSSVGIFRARIFIPHTLISDTQRLHHIVAHEKTHVRNLDGLWGALALVLRRLCWFNPFIILFERKRILAMEMATDEQTLLRFGFEPSDYARSLVDALAFGRESDVWVRGAALDFAQMKHRLRNLQPRESRSSLRFYPILVFIIMASGWLGGVKQAFASLKLKQSAGEMMCYQVQHEKFIDGWLHLKAETNKCE